MHIILICRKGQAWQWRRCGRGFLCGAGHGFVWCARFDTKMPFFVMIVIVTVLLCGDGDFSTNGRNWLRRFFWLCCVMYVTWKRGWGKYMCVCVCACVARAMCACVATDGDYLHLYFYLVHAWLQMVTSFTCTCSMHIFWMHVAHGLLVSFSYGVLCAWRLRVMYIYIYIYIYVYFHLVHAWLQMVTTLTCMMHACASLAYLSIYIYTYMYIYCFVCIYDGRLSHMYVHSCHIWACASWVHLMCMY